MKNKLKYLIILFCIPAALFAQTKAKHQTFQEIKKEREAYFAKQILERGSAYLQQEGGEYSQYKNWLSIWEPRIGPGNSTVEDYINRLTESVNSEKIKSRSGNGVAAITDPWTELGPTKTPTTGLYSIGGGQKGIGPIQYITFYKQNPNVMLAASCSGGLFYSEDKGNNWKNAGSDKWTMSGCTSAAFSPVDATTWYGCSNLGSGSNRHNPENSFAIGPGGVWRTTNKGVSYTLIANKDHFTTLGNQTTIHKILIDPNNAAVGYVATTGGLYKSININTATPTWLLIQTGNIEDVELKANNSNIIFITLQTTYTPGSNGYSQTNNWAMQVSTTWGGIATTGSWATITAPSGGFISNQCVPPRGEPGNLEMTVTEADANLIYVQDVQYSGPAEKIFTYNYNTGVWTLRNTLNNLEHGIGRGFGVSNTNAAIVYVSNYINLYKSTDYGATLDLLYPLSVETPYHTDIEFVVTPPLQYCASCGTDVFIAHHGGVSYSSNACSTIIEKSNGLGVAEAYGNVSQSGSNSKKILVGLYHDGSVMSDPVTGNDPWQTVQGGDGFTSVIDQTDDNNVWTSYNVWEYPGFGYSNTGGGANTYNASTVFNNISNTPVVQNVMAPNYFYFKYAPIINYEQVFRSNDKGVSNSEQITNFTNLTSPSSNINFIAGSPSNSNYLYIDNVYSSVHHLMRNLNVNALAATVKTSWQNLTLPSSEWYMNGLGRFIVDNYNPNIIYLTYWGGFVWKADYSNVGSPIFTNMSGNLPVDVSTGGLIMERGSNGGFYVSSDMGIYYTNNEYQSSGTWVKVSELPNIIKSSIDINYTINKIRVGTFGRGVWEHDLVCPTQDILPLNGSIAPGFYEANYINATNALTAPNASTTFRATKSITLNPNFIAEALPGSYFQAFIHGCSGPGNSFIVDNGSETAVITEEDEEKQSRVEETAMRVFPNPSNGSFNLAFANKDSKNVYVYDIMGKLIFKQESIRENKLQVDITNQPAGIYLIKVVSGAHVISKKVIVQ